jgi:hypothetical protein
MGIVRLKNLSNGHFHDGVLDHRLVREEEGRASPAQYPNLNVP